MSTNKNKKVIKIEIEKNKLIKTSVITVLILAVFLICFLVSNSKSESYSTSKSTETTEQDDTGILQQATKEAGEISDDERTSPNEISIDEYINLYGSSDYSLVLISRPTCQYCKIATPIIENIIYEKNVNINYLNSDNFSEEDNNKLISSDGYFSEGYGTPLLLVVGNNSIKDKIEGLTSKDSYEAFFKQYGFME